MILLVRPPFGAFPEVFGQVNPPIGLGYIAAHVEKRSDFQVRILDMARINASFKTVRDYILKHEPVLVGISALTFYYDGTRRLCRYLKNQVPALKIAIGGVHPSFLPALSLQETGADVVVIGEGEETTLELSEAIRAANSDDELRKRLFSIKGIGFLDENGHYTFTGARQPIMDLDALPFPAWHKIKPNRYPKIPHGFMMKHERVAPILSTRGCPFDCSYCASCRFWGQRIRFRSPKNVVDEIEYLHREFGIREIHFWDDNLTLRRDHIIGICKEIIRRGLNHMAFCTPNGVRVDTLDETILRWMRAAGFYKLTFAVESGDREVLRENGKYTSLLKILRNARVAKKLGFILNSYFILGFPQDTGETMRKTIRFAKSLPFDYRQFFILKPLPGSRIFEKWREKIDLKNFDWKSLSGYWETRLEPLSGHDAREMNRIYKRANEEANNNLKALLNNILLKVRYFHPSQLKYHIDQTFHLVNGYQKSIFNGKHQE